MYILLSRCMSYDHGITKDIDCVILFNVFVFRLLCCKYFEYAGFQWLMQVQQHIHLQDNGRHSVTVSQRF